VHIRMSHAYNISLLYITSSPINDVEENLTKITILHTLYKNLMTKSTFFKNYLIMYINSMPNIKVFIKKLCINSKYRKKNYTEI